MPALLTATRMRRSFNKYKRKYKQVDKDYPVGPGTLLIITRPCNHKPFQRFYPFYHYSFFMIENSTLGFHFCDWANFIHCPDEFGPTLMPDHTTFPIASDTDNWDYFLVIEDDPEQVQCVIDTAYKIYPEYRYPSEIRAITMNVYNRFMADVLKQCGVE